MARPPVPSRPYSAPVDTSGMDEAMKDTMLKMRGPGGSARPQGTKPVGGDPFSSFMRGIHGIFQKKQSPTTPPAPQMSKEEEDRLSKKYLGR